MTRSLHLFPWTVRYSATNEGFIVYIPATSVIGHILDLSALTPAITPKRSPEDEDTPLADWYVVPGQVDEAVFALFGEPSSETGAETLAVTLAAAASTDAGLISIQLATVTYDATTETASVVPYVSGALTLPTGPNSEPERKEPTPVAWTVRRKTTKRDNGETETSWEVYSPIWTWGKGDELLAKDMAEGWNAIPSEVTTGTLYAVLELEGTKDASGNVTWIPKELTLKNAIDDLTDSEPSGEGSSATTGARWRAVRIGAFPEPDTSISPEDDDRPFIPLHVGLIVDQPFASTIATSYDIVTGLRYDAGGHKLICRIRTWNGRTLGPVRDGDGLSLQTHAFTASKLRWNGNTLIQQDFSITLQLFEAPVSSLSQSEVLFATAPHEADETTPYEGSLTNLPDSNAVP